MLEDSLGELERVDLRGHWLDEARNFTPWLARSESLELLSSALGMELELEGLEVPVGPYKADVVARDVSSDTRVIVENQLEKTDHDHLGKTITCASGLDAHVAIWIAKEFSEEHRRALDFLNENAAPDLRCFGIEIQLWKRYCWFIHQGRCILREVVQQPSLLENRTMSMHPQPIGPVPEDTARVARAAFPKGSTYIEMRDVLGSIYEDEDFEELFEVRGRPAIAPWRLALVTVMQFSEGLSDRQAAEAVRARIDWKYALGLELSDPGFDFSVLSEFRSRLLEGGKERLLLEKLLEACKERGYLKVRGRARTDSTHVLGALRVLSKWERTAETMRSALNALASVDPEWLREHADPEWFERYGRRIEDQRLPKGKEAREEYLKTVGADGMRLLAHIDDPHTPQGLKELAEVEILRQIWEQHYEQIDGEIRVLDPKERCLKALGA